MSTFAIDGEGNVGEPISGLISSVDEVRDSLHCVLVPNAVCLKSSLA